MLCGKCEGFIFSFSHALKNTHTQLSIPERIHKNWKKIELIS